MSRFASFRHLLCLWLLAVFGLRALAVCNVNIPESTPTADLTVSDPASNGEYVVTHSKTGLMWKQCSEGLSGASCGTGTATAMTWESALAVANSTSTTPFAGYSDWRLPNRKELESITESRCHSPSINETQFPGTPATGNYWSATTYARSASSTDSAWLVNFSNGFVGGNQKTNNWYVRLVRGGQSFGPFDNTKVYAPTAPTFTAVTGATPSAATASNTVTLAGLTTVTGVKVLGGEYSLDGGTTYVSTPGAVAANGNVKVRTTASATLLGNVSATLTVGGVDAVFSVTTAATVSVANNPDLSTLTLSAGSLSPAFQASTTAYSATVANSVGSISLTPVLSDVRSSVTVNGSTVPSGQASNTIALALGVNTITLVSSTPSGVSKTYTVTITRLASSNADLASLSLAGATLTPVFAATTNSYSASIVGRSISVQASAADSNATISINGGAATNVTAAATVPLNVGVNNLSVTVTAQDGKTSKTYNLLLTRELAKDAGLSGLSLSTGTLNPPFASHISQYNVTVPASVSQISLTPLLVDADASVSIRGASITSGAASALPLAMGANAISLDITAADGQTRRSYVLNIARQSASLALSGVSGASYDFGSLAVGQIASVALTLSNPTGGNVAQLGGFDIAAPFAASSNCPAQLVGGANCAVTLTFTPKTVDASASGNKLNAVLSLGGNAFVNGLPLQVSGTAYSNSPSNNRYFYDSNGVAQNTLVLSNEMVPNINSSTAVSITGGEYSINGAGFTSKVGNIGFTDRIRVRHTSANQPAASMATLLTIGSDVYSFRSKTAASALSFTSRLPDGAVSVTETAEGFGADKKTSLDAELDLSKIIPHVAAKSYDAYNVYLVAIAANTAGTSPLFFQQMKTRNWNSLGGQLQPTVENIAPGANSIVRLSVASEILNWNALSGIEFYVGIGQSSDEMITSKRYQGVYRVP